MLAGISLMSVLALSLISAPAQGQIKGGLLNEQLQKAGEQAFEPTTGEDLPQIIGRYIQIFLGFLGVIALVLVVYGGFLWMTAAGNEEQVTKAKDLLKNAIIGLIIITLAFAITNFVITSIQQAAR